MLLSLKCHIKNKSKKYTMIRKLTTTDEMDKIKLISVLFT